MMGIKKIHFMYKLNLFILLCRNIFRVFSLDRIMEMIPIQAIKSQICQCLNFVILNLFFFLSIGGATVRAKSISEFKCEQLKVLIKSMSKIVCVLQ